MFGKATKLLELSGNLKKDVQTIVREMYRFSTDIEFELRSIDGKNMTEAYKKELKEQTELPIGSMLLRQTITENGGMKYGEWRKTEMIKTEAEKKLYIYTRVK